MSGIYVRPGERVDAWRVELPCHSPPDWLVDAVGRGQVAFERLKSPDPVVIVDTGARIVTLREGDWLVLLGDRIAAWPDAAFRAAFQGLEVVPS